MASTLTIKALTRREIANLLGMEEHTFARKLKKKNISLPRGLVSPQYQKIIFDAFWYPKAYPKEAFQGI
jgi:hypothetical protein